MGTHMEIEDEAYHDITSCLGVTYFITSDSGNSRFERLRILKSVRHIFFYNREATSIFRHVAESGRIKEFKAGHSFEIWSF